MPPVFRPLIDAYVVNLSTGLLYWINMVSASKLKISSREWARLGVPMGLVIMVVYFVILMF